MLAQKQAELSDASPKFAELPPPTDEKQPTTTEKQTDLVASEREVREITPQQYRWLMEGLQVEQPKAHRPVTGLTAI